MVLMTSPETVLVEPTHLEFGSFFVFGKTWRPANSRTKNAPEIVLAHDGLGSVEQWRTIPAKLAERTNKTVFAYDRPGHGKSTPIPTGSWPTRWLHDEADRLGQILTRLGQSRPILVGHSDGASLSLLHAAQNRSVRGVVSFSAHSWVEPVCVEKIMAMRTQSQTISSGLDTFHANGSALFEAWSGVWVSDEFAQWDIRPLLNRIACPALIAQGSADEYASPEHVDLTAAAIGQDAQTLLLPGLRHLLHHQAPDTLVDVAGAFIEKLR